MRIGVPFFGNNTECACCGDALLDPFGSHSLRCALAAGNRGHNAVRDELLAIALLADPTACIEPIHLIPYFPKFQVISAQAI